ncbi:MAG TPA: hypothetical protein VHZ03_06090 [Trebonia sp.]|jgi:hypothetical protein|nr:hypothetical protein [Trebonia sp.]
MDWLLEIRDGLEKRVFDSLVLGFVAEDEDEPVVRGVNGMPLTSEDIGDDEGKQEPAGSVPGGRSKDYRDDLPQFIIGMAVTMDGIPVRVCCWPGSTNDSALIRQVKATRGTVACRRSSSGSPTTASPRTRTAANCGRRRELHRRGEDPLRDRGCRPRRRPTSLGGAAGAT